MIMSKEEVSIPVEPLIFFASGRCVQIEKDMLLDDQLKDNVENCKKGINEFTSVIGRVITNNITDEEIDKYLESMTNELIKANLFKITEYTNLPKKDVVVMMASTLISFFSTILYVAAHEYIDMVDVSDSETTVTE